MDNELEKQFREKITKYKKYVIDVMMQVGPNPSFAVVRDDIDENYVELAKVLVEIQAQKGEYARRDLPKNIYSKISSIADKFGISKDEVIETLVNYNKYLSPKRIEVNNICAFIQDFMVVYKKYYEQYGFFPINALSQFSRDFLANKKVNLGLEDKLKILLSEYLPDYANIEIRLKSYEALPQNHVRDKKELKTQIKIVEGVAENGNLDCLLLPINVDVLNNLLRILKANKISFDDFASQNNFTYTKLYEVDSMTAVIGMILTYFKNSRTYKNITINDHFLRGKIDIVESQYGISSLKDILAKYFIDSDNFDNGQSLTLKELRLREFEVFTTLGLFYPNHIVNGVSNNSQLKREYANLVILARRFGFKNIDEYLQSKGFYRDNSKKDVESKMVIVLSLEDALKYGLFGDSFEEFQRNYDAHILPLEHNVEVYKRVYGKTKKNNTKEQG